MDRDRPGNQPPELEPSQEARGEPRNPSSSLRFDNRSIAVLQEGEYRLACLMANLPGMIYRCLNNTDWTMEFVSEGCLPLTGYRPVDLIGDREISYVELIHPDDREAVWEEVQAALEQPRSFELRYRLITAAGEEKWVWERGYGVYAPDGKLLALEGFITDITQQVQAEKALRRQIVRVSLLNEIARAIAERQDLNSVFRVVLGELESRLAADFGAIYLLDSAAETFTVAAYAPRSQELAAEIELPEGTRLAVGQARSWGEGELVYIPDVAVSDLDTPVLRRWAEIGLRSVVEAPLVVEGRVLGVLFVARRAVDGFSSRECEFLKGLSEHVSLAARQTRLYRDLQVAYDELRETQRAVMGQVRLRALGQMASGIAHDINNAISPAVIYIDLLEREPDLSDRAKHYLKTVKMAHDDVAQIVMRMREFYRKRDEQESLSPVSLNETVQQVIELTRPRWSDMPQERGIVIDMQSELQSDLPPVMGIESEIREALTNLIFNSVDAMPQGGTLTVRTYVDGGKEDSMRPPRVVLTVTDSGIGMDAETKERCFEPFFTTKGDQGTGLGLAVVYGVMQRHDADIDVESTLGEGTTMRLIFPVGEPIEARAAGPQPGAHLSPLRILLVDDEPLLRQALKETLEDEGHTVEAASGGQAGLDLFRAADEREEPFDVVITDLGMPYVDGRQVSRTVKAESPAIPVVLLTGWGVQMGAKDDLPAGVDYLLSKPPTMSELHRVLANVKVTR